uniref:Schlafen family member 13 n=1 Tax=Jaculus jaculus TaxID=51337 RepID=A0A8C5P3A3_JACJA
MWPKSTSLSVKPFSTDLIIDAGKVTLGEGNRKKMNSSQREQERKKLAQAACALLNSGGGVIEMEMANRFDHPVELGLDLERSLRELIQSDFQTFFETNQKGGHFYIFVKSWNCGPFPEDRSTKPRICSLSSSLFQRYGTSVHLLESRDAFDFLKTKIRNIKCSLINEGAPPAKMLRAVHQNSSESHAFQLFNSEKLEYGAVLPFPESDFIEFKQFSTKSCQEYVKDIIPKYISAFANSCGGYLFIGVEDNSKKVMGCPKDNGDRNSLEKVIAEAISKLPIVHFSSSEARVSYKTNVIDVFREGELHGYLCAIKVEPFCCAVFSKAPNSWMVDEKKGVYSLTSREWADMMTDADPGATSNLPPNRSLSDTFECQLSLYDSPPRCRPVYSRKGLEHKADLQQHLFPVSQGCLIYTPKPLWEELSSQHEGLRDLLEEQMRPCSCGVLILSRSWAVDLDLEEKQEVICDALLIAQNSPPTLFTVLGEQDGRDQYYCTRTAFTLKQKLVNMGGYPGKIRVTTRILYLSPKSSAQAQQTSRCPIDYPSSYNLADTQQMEALLQALVIVLLGFRSFLSDELGCEILNLLTAQQYEIFSKNLHKTKELFVHGLPGSGKTIMAMKIMEKIRTMFPCEAHRILYICENQPLRDLISSQNVCHAVTRKTFMMRNFEEFKHIVIDEAQNFRTENGDWYQKAKAITQREKNDPGILWIFLDYFQTNHLDDSGLPPYSCQYPREILTKVVRNADKIASYLQNVMQEVRKNPPPNIFPGSLELFHEPEQVQGVSGILEIMYLNLEKMVFFVAKKCQLLWRSGYSSRDIAVLFSTTDEMYRYKDKFLREMKKRKVSQVNNESSFTNLMFDSVRRFSGLERNIVFGINPQTADPAISHNLLLCLASRAKKHLYILYL